MADISVTAGNVAASTDAVIRMYEVGATITAGQPVYVNSVTGRIHPAQAAAAGSDELARAVGIAVGGGGAGQGYGQYIGVLVKGRIIIGGTAVIGVIYRVSATAGGITPHTDAATSTALTTQLGVGVSATTIEVEIVYGGRLA